MHDTGLVIRKAEPESLARSAEFIRLVSSQMNEIGSPKPDDEIRTTIAKLSTSNNCAEVFIAEADGKMIGFALLNVCFGLESGGEYLWLNELHVDPRYQGRGIGSRMFERIKSYAKESGVKRVLGLCGNNLIRYYKNRGFDCETTTLFSSP